jgi:DEAD/DEAH box helicase domain-containing protein
MDYCVFDIQPAKGMWVVKAELGLKDERSAFGFPHRMGFSIGCTFSPKDKFKFFTTPQEMADYLLKCKGRLISFNGTRFGLPLLLGELDIDRFLQLQHLPHLDILADFYDRVQGRFRVSLDNMAKASLGRGKINDVDSPLLFEEGRLNELSEYCQRNVELIDGLYDFGLKNRKIRFSGDNKQAEIKVNYDEAMP